MKRGGLTLEELHLLRAMIGGEVISEGMCREMGLTRSGVWRKWDRAWPRFLRAIDWEVPREERDFTLQMYGEELQERVTDLMKRERGRLGGLGNRKNSRYRPASLSRYALSEEKKVGRG